VARTTATSAAELADKNYRIRRLLVVLDIDLYDTDGMLISRGETDPIVLNEADVPGSLVGILTAVTQLGKGFAIRPVPADPAA